MIKEFGVLLAKSCNTPDVPRYSRLAEHLRTVALAGDAIVKAVGPLILEQLSLPPDPWSSRLRSVVRVACLCHDLGKANDGFQRMVRGLLDPRRQPARHELLSALLLEDKQCFVRQWALKELRKSREVPEPNDETVGMLMDCVIGAAAGHHVKLDRGWTKAALALQGGCGTELQIMLDHPELRTIFEDSVAHKVRFSLVENEAAYLGDRQLPFNLQSSRWLRKLDECKDWWRFAAAVKALTMAADVAGSAMPAENQDIRKWIGTSLSQRVEQEQMHAVVKARLKGRALRPFQAAIGESRVPVTLVEAGCGTGKTVAAYLWAARHACGRKLFFCYPTTGTATEGFLGYVHETDVEAELIHSRAVVDLEGVAQTPDDEDEDHLLRIESLCAWGPQVVICTADTVLALVRNNRRGLYNSPSILSGAFVFDELHAYDNHMLAALVALISAMPGAHFLLMTASLPTARKQFLSRYLQDLGEVTSPVDLQEVPRYKLQRADSEVEAHEVAQSAMAHGKRVLWICNTVARAQKIFDVFGPKARAYHSRFKYQDRVKRHRDIIEAFIGEQRGLLAVTTQVAEMSLDLNADLLVSEVAPIPALIQRLGRLNRWVTPQQPGCPRVALFTIPERALPYENSDLDLAGPWIDSLIALKRPLSQTDLSNYFDAFAPQENLVLDTRMEWLDSGWWATPGSVREPSITLLSLINDYFLEFGSAPLAAAGLPHQIRLHRPENPFPRHTRSFFWCEGRR